jgi:tape measure domain-containing protein
MLQLSQALGSGTVRAEEFNSILEGAVPIAQAAAAGLEEAGGSVAKLRTLVLAGKVSSEAFFRAIQAGQYVVEQQAESMQGTIAQAFNVLENRLIAVAREVNKVGGVSRAMGDVFTFVGDG